MTLFVTWQSHRVYVDEVTDAGNDGEQWTMVQGPNPGGAVYAFAPSKQLPDNQAGLPKNWIIV